MPERRPSDLPESGRLTAVVVGAVVGIVLTLGVLLDLGVVEIGLILLALLALAAAAVGLHLWARRRGDR